MWDNDKFPVRLILNGQATKEIEWHCKVRSERSLSSNELGADLRPLANSTTSAVVS
jgi:hypothetical protein